MPTDDERREVARRLRELRLKPWDDTACEIASCVGIVCCNSECHGSDETPECTMALAHRLADLIEPSDRRRVDEWRDFATDPPSEKRPVLCKSANGKVYVGNPCFFANDTFTGEVWVPRGDRYRKPAKWMEIDDDYR